MKIYTITEDQLKRLLILSGNNKQIEGYISYIKKENRSKISKKTNHKKKLSDRKQLQLKEKAAKFKKQLVANQTKSEKVFKALLKGCGIKYIFQKIFYADKSFYIVDFYLPDYNIVVEIDGGYHNTKEQIIADRKRTGKLKKYNNIKKVIRFTNKDVGNHAFCIRELEKIKKSP